GWKTVVPQREQTIESAALIGGRGGGEYLVDGQSRLMLFESSGTPQGEVVLPGVGTVTAIRGRQDHTDIWYGFSSPLVPTTVFRFEPATGKSASFEAAVPPIDANQFETRALFAASRDGTRVPFFLTAKKNL